MIDKFDNLKHFSALSGIGVQVLALDGSTVYATPQYEHCLPVLAHIDGLMDGALDAQNRAAMISGALQSYRFGGRFFFYSAIGFFHFASPLITDGRHMLTCIGGPILMVSLDDYIQLDLDGKLREGYDRNELLLQLGEIPRVSPDTANTLSEQLLINAKHLSDSEYLRLGQDGGENRYSEYILAYFSGTPSYESILRLAAEQRREKATQKHEKFIRIATDYIEKNCAKHITLAEVAAQVFISPSYLSRLIKSRTGHTFRHLVNMSRIAESVRLLENTELSLIAIAIAAGFRDHSYFTKIFKKHTGMNPSDYRAELRKQ
ncbi:MAG: helix-turn-helix domain-containing protein [Clostridiales Family XIII bacterium]|jgi:AraC-like DNA-binding protein|nr:helix-turn-helix domain-containing protein [Clostridiales Family XIII bacterium]